MYIKIEDKIVTDIQQNETESYYFVYDDIPVQIGHNVTFDEQGNITGFYTGPKIDENLVKEDEIRLKRDSLLQETDWIVIKAVDTQTPIPEEWAVYRQALRDITLHPNFPNLEDTDWPIKP